MDFRSRLRDAAVVTLLVGVSIFSGCGPTLATVEGTVTGADGELLKGGQVEIHTAKGVRIAQIEEGRYVLHHVPLGEAKVTVRPGMPPAPVESDVPLEPGKSPETIDAKMVREMIRLKRVVPEKYQTFESTPLQLDVKAGANRLPIQLQP